MKKIYLLAFSLIGISQANAQITLTKAGFEPTIGDTYDTKDLDSNMTALPMNISGTNVLWNVTSVFEAGTVNTYSYTAPTGTATSSYPGTTIVQENQTSGDMSYFKSTATSYELLAANISIGGIGAELNYNTNSAVIASYPITMGYTNNDTGAGTISASGNSGTFTSTIQTTADATGTLNFNGLASANYMNCLRLKTVQHINFSLSYMGFPVTGTVDQVIYNYYVSAFKAPLFTVNYNHVQAAIPGTPIDQHQDMLSCLSNVVVGIGEKSVNDITFKAYPNPASSEVLVHFVLTQKESYTIDIINTMGQVVRTVAKPDLQPGLYNESININGLAAGVYHLKVSGKNSTGIEKLVIE
jgi:hypothetical protein